MGSWYPVGAARLAREFARLKMPYQVIIEKPQPDQAFHEMGYDYTAYISKPRLLAQMMGLKADVKLLLDASFWPIRDIAPLVEHIIDAGYYLCRNGNTVGEWSSQRCLNALNFTRAQAWEIEEVSSYAVGILAASPWGRMLADTWLRWSRPDTICGAHTNALHPVPGQRNPGVVAHDERVKGHRHDQTVLSLAASFLGCHQLVNRPKFTAYKGTETEETVLVCEGMSGRFQA